ncbi:MAG: hypothetical protein WKF82_05680 [Nocardioidaceae bacterium]
MNRLVITSQPHAEEGQCGLVAGDGIASRPKQRSPDLRREWKRAREGHDDAGMYALPPERNQFGLDGRVGEATGAELRRRNAARLTFDEPLQARA